jgi:signal transduction histidine kinase
MREVLTVLREPGEPASAPLPGLADLASLAEGLTAGGVPVTSSVTTEPVPEGVQLTAYRVVQEALTNAVRHAPGAAVEVDVRVEGARLLVAVRSHGAAGPARPGGSGVDGMRARVTAAGGELRAGPVDGAWSVEASLPMGAA